MYFIRILKLIFFSLISVSILSSCATIIGGSKYNAYVNVDGNKDAKIFYNDIFVGTGRGIIPIQRKDADNVTFLVSQKGCPDQKYDFRTSKFRGWSFGGSLLLSISLSGIPIPIIIDAVTGALYQPDYLQPMITKSNFKNYTYNLPYQCDIPSQEKYNTPINNQPVKVVQTKEDKLIELKELYDKGMITQQEYQSSRQAVLNQ